MRMGFKLGFYLLNCIVLIGLFSGCYEPPANSPNDNYIFTGSGKGTIIGRVTNRYGDGVNASPVGIPGVAVQLLMPTSVKEYRILNTIYTDSDGSFKIEDIPAGDNVIIDISKEGYIQTQKITKVISDKISYVNAAITDWIDNENINASTGGKFHSLGAEIEIPANSLVTENGTDFIGNARVEITVYEPSILSYSEAFPGKFEGYYINYKLRPFLTFFLMHVKFFNLNDELFLKPGKKAIASFPILKQLASKAPDVISIWDYDFTIGIWNENSTAQKNGSKYIGEVSKFGFLTVAVPMDVSYLAGRAIDQNSMPIEHAKIKSVLNDFGWQSETYSEADGSFKINVLPYFAMTVSAKYLEFSSEPLKVSTTPDANQTLNIGDIIINTEKVEIPGTWTELNKFSEYDVWGVYFADENMGWATVHYKEDMQIIGKIYKTTDGGTNWKVVYTGVNTSPSQIVFKGNTGWVNAGDGILKTTDAGETWGMTLENAQGLLDMYILDESKGWAVGVDYYRTNNGGEKWTRGIIMPFDIYLTIFFIDENKGWAGGPLNLIKTTDGGNMWTQVNLSQAVGSYFDIHFYDKELGFVVGGNGSIHRTSDGGNSWIATELEGLPALRCIKMVDSNTGWIVGDGGTILYTNNSGKTWVETAKVTNESFYDLFLLNENIGWAVGTNGAIFKYSKE